MNRQEIAEQLEHAASAAAMRPATDTIAICAQPGDWLHSGYAPNVMVVLSHIDKLTAGDLAQIAAYVREASDAQEQIAKVLAWALPLAIMSDPVRCFESSSLSSMLETIDRGFRGLQGQLSRLQLKLKKEQTESSPPAEMQRANLTALLANARGTFAMAEEHGSNASALRELAFKDLEAAIELLTKK